MKKRNHKTLLRNIFTIPLIIVISIISFTSCIQNDDTNNLTLPNNTDTPKEITATIAPQTTNQNITPTHIEIIPSPTQDKEYVFIDEIFGELIKKALGKTDNPVYYSDILSINNISLFGEFIWVNDDTILDIGMHYDRYIYNGQEYFPNDYIKSFEDLSNFKNLSELRLNYCKIDDISFLSEMIQLTDLSLYGNDIEDITILSDLTNLVSLDVMCNKLTNCNGIEKMIKLKYLYLGGNKRFSDISPIKNLSDLQVLGLHGLDLTDIQDLSHLYELKILDISYNKIIDISPLTNLPNLRSLNAQGNKISDISSFADKDMDSFVH